MIKFAVTTQMNRNVGNIQNNCADENQSNTKFGIEFSTQSDGSIGYLFSDASNPTETRAFIKAASGSTIDLAKVVQLSDNIHSTLSLTQHLLVSFVMFLHNKAMIVSSKQKLWSDR